VAEERFSQPTRWQVELSPAPNPLPTIAALATVALGILLVLYLWLLPRHWAPADRAAAPPVCVEADRLALVGAARTPTARRLRAACAHWRVTVRPAPTARSRAGSRGTPPSTQAPARTGPPRP
jgi:hypothetical protein